jgi:hypothetical protein
MKANNSGNSNDSIKESHNNTTATLILDKHLKKRLSSHFSEESVIRINCTYTAPMDGKIRIWNHTILFDQDSGKQFRMLMAFNIPTAPKWKYIRAGTALTFTLLFPQLPHDCTMFDLLENAHVANGFIVHSIQRNEKDIYSVIIT